MEEGGIAWVQQVQLKSPDLDIQISVDGSVFSWGHLVDLGLLVDCDYSYFLQARRAASHLVTTYVRQFPLTHVPVVL